MLRALFINHDLSYYGAATSLRLLLQNYKNIMIDMLVNKSVGTSSTIGNVKERFGNSVINIFEYSLPYDFCFLGSRKISTTFVRKRILNEFAKRQIYSLIAEKDYDFIYLNSLILHSLINKNYPFIIHVREIYDYSNKKVFESLKNAHGVIFIDKTTKKPFQSCPLRNYIILNNPFDMTKPDKDSFLDLGLNIDYKNKTVFAFIGNHNENKGTDFVISCFKKLTNDNIILLIVGRDDERYLQYCKRLADDDRRIVFYGIESDILKIYYISDYIFRGEPYFCVGRTIYEGLYAGCDVIIPGNNEDKSKLFEYERFKDKIHFYTPRDSNELEVLLKEVSCKKVYGRIYFSNVTEYVKQFNDFAMKCIGAC